MFVISVQVGLPYLRNLYIERLIHRRYLDGKAWIRKINPSLAENPAYGDVLVSVMTDAGCTISATGTVPSEKAFRDLKNLLETNDSPIGLEWHVVITNQSR